MILTKAPLRISFFGGGSDLASHYSKHGGAVLSAAIDKYMYIALNTTPQEHVKLSYSVIEHVKNYKELKHDIVRNVIECYGGKHKIGLEIGSYADIPTVGTGLGSSSTFAVALIQAFASLNGYNPSPQIVADAACDIEINWCRSPIGKQDQFAAAYGGMNYFMFDRDDYVRSIEVDKQYFGIKQNLLMFYTGVTRSANAILAQQNARPDHEALKKMADQALLGFNLLKSERYDDFGDLLHDAWVLKSGLTPGITNESIDGHYIAAMANGALGGKILGAGGGGYFLFYVPKDSQERVIHTLECRGLKHIDFNFSETGVQTVYNDSSL